MTEKNIISLPAFVDMHVHFREPGFSYKETIATGSEAARCAGYSDVATMPNLNPAPDTLEHLQMQLDLIAQTSRIGVHPYACITMGQKGGGELVDFDKLAPLVVGFSDDGRGVQDKGLMREAMQACQHTGSMIVEHCEVNELLRGGYIHDGAYARAHGHKGICSESEWREVERNIDLVAETGCPLHVCHISTKESVMLIREAKRQGLPVTTETAPHYLLLTEDDLQENGCWKMNPPLRTNADRDALLEGLQDGTIDCIATDHAPHSEEEKSRGLEKSAFGIVGIETAFPLVYTYLVKRGLLTFDRMTDAMSLAPRRLLKLKGEVPMIEVDLNASYRIDAANFISKGKSTPFNGWEVFGKVNICTNK